jgi:hypothetical protein
MKINKRSRPRVEYIAPDVPMIAIDDFYDDPDEVRARALEGQFKDTGAGYPGRHEALDPQQDISVARVINHVRQVVERGSGLAVDSQNITTDFSILTTPKEKVLKVQSHPHTDNVALAGLIYLNKKRYGGTCFYKNKLLNACVLVAENQEEYDRLTQDYDANFKDVDGYVSGSYDQWELVYRTDGRYNQFVMYPGNVFHSVDVVENPDPSQPKLARLTQRFFINAILPR